MTTIHEIQGSALTSAIVGTTVTTSGIVTAIDTNGFYIQAADAEADLDPNTSEGIFVFTGGVPTVATGDRVDVTGVVVEFVAPGSVAGALSVTEIAGSVSVSVVSTGNPLPTSVTLISPETSFTGLEKYEGMRVSVVSPLVTGPTNTFEEIWVVPSAGTGSTGLNTRGDMLISAGAQSFGNTDTVGGDFNPERIQIDPGLGTSIPNASVGAMLNTVTGIVSYSFGNYEVLATAPVTVATTSLLAKTSATLTGDASHLLVASYNAENLDPGDGAARFTTVATEIITRLNAPDVIALQNIQDNNGPTNDATTSASLTLQMIVDAVNASGGPTYAFLDNLFIGDDTSGGEPGGNIRTAYLYRTDHVSFIAGSLRTIGANGSAITGGPDTTQQTDPNNPFFNSRPPLAADFIFNREIVTVVNVHFTSKGGSGVLAGSIQPPFDAGEVQRAAQAQAVNNFIDSLLASNPSARVIVTGDLNEFGFEQPLDVLKGTASISGYAGNSSNPAISATATYTPGGTQILSNLLDALPADQRFNFLLDGNAVAIGHMLVSSALSTGAQFQNVHINAEFFDQTGDHDPLVGRFTINLPPPTLHDFDDDGRGDILWQHDDGSAAVWLMDGTGATSVGPPLTSLAGPSWRAMDAADFNGDRKADVLWQNDDGSPAVWLMNGTGVVERGPPLADPGPGWHVIAGADFNADGRADILWQNDDGTPAVWLMNGLSVMSMGPALPNPGPAWTAIDAADFNADGRADILWQNDDGTSAVWLMDGTGVTAFGPALPNPGPAWHAKAAGDFNADGRADILWQNDDGTPAVWLMNGTALAAMGPPLANPGADWDAKDAVDFNDDGKTDILWQRDSGPSAVWLMDGTAAVSIGAPLDAGPGWHVV